MVTQGHEWFEGRPFLLHFLLVELLLCLLMIGLLLLSVGPSLAVGHTYAIFAYEIAE